MTSKMKVDELRAELEQQGLVTTGTKPTLVKRLDAALRKEKKEEAAVDKDSEAFTSKKRSREESEDGNEVKEEEDVKKKEKLVVATKKGAAVLDQWLPDSIKTQYHVLEKGGVIYDAMLNQTNVGENNNKFYVIQVLEADDKTRFMVYNRWGRVGIKGQDKLQGPFTSVDSAIQEFECNFYAKTKNHWSNRNEFISYPRSYTWLEMDYTGKDTDPNHCRRHHPNSPFHTIQKKLCILV